MGKKRGKREAKQTLRDVRHDDQRFAAAHNRPQFRVGSGKKQDKFFLDDRFASVLTDPRFKLQEKDKYGRGKKKRRKNEANELEAFYTVAKADEKQGDDDDGSSSAASSSSSNSSHQSSSKRQSRKEPLEKEYQEEEEEADPASRIAYLTALSRGELDVSSSSSSEDDVSDDSSQSDSGDESSLDGEDPVHGTAGILDPSNQQNQEIEITNDSSPFLAVTNLDWTYVRAVDIFVLLSSFTPPGAVRRVQVFVSDFGKEKMTHELTHGPPSLWKKTKDTSDNDDEDEDKQTKTNNSNTDAKDGIKDDMNDSHSGGDDIHDDENVEDEEMDADQYFEFIQQAHAQPTESDFDPEKLRAYEASKLKYYFAVVEFSKAGYADIAYKEVDGMEFEHSSAAVDLRCIPQDAVGDVTEGRELRDEATSVPGGYVPPEFIVTALQQTNVQCTWEAGDTERERMLTKYHSAEQWASYAENDDLKAYLASSDEDESGSEDENDKESKGAKLRQMLGLVDDGDDNLDENGDDQKERDTDLTVVDKNDIASDSENETSKEIRFIPGKRDLEEKIRVKLQQKEDQAVELTPFEKYKEKRREKRRERRQASRQKRGSHDINHTANKRSDSKIEKDTSLMNIGKTKREEFDEAKQNKKLSREELELLLTGDNDEEVLRDFDMRGLRRIEKNKEKKLKGSRKRKEEKLAAGVSGQDFAVNLKDDRFAAVLDGEDGRFGIDRTDPLYKETPAMKEILTEQKARRRKKRKRKSAGEHGSTEVKLIPPNVVEGSSMKGAGSVALRSLVKSLKTKVASNLH